MLALYSEEDCVLEEIKVVTIYSDDLEAVDHEQSGYVVDDDDEEGDHNDENMVPGLRGKKSVLIEFCSLHMVKVLEILKLSVISHLSKMSKPVASTTLSVVNGMTPGSL